MHVIQTFITYLVNLHAGLADWASACIALDLHPPAITTGVPVSSPDRADA
jgi:hypothetical protein